MSTTPRGKRKGGDNCSSVFRVRDHGGYVHVSLGLTPRVCCFAIGNCENSLLWESLESQNAVICRRFFEKFRYLAENRFICSGVVLLHACGIEIDILVGLTVYRITAKGDRIEELVPRDHGDVRSNRVGVYDCGQIRHYLFLGAKVQRGDH